MKWLLEAASDDITHRVSSKRVCMLLAGLAMSVAIVVLAMAALAGHPVAGELAAVSMPLAGMCGYSYVNGKAAESKP